MADEFTGVLIVTTGTSQRSPLRSCAMLDVPKYKILDAAKTEHGKQSTIVLP
jgi:hypothetical protein